MGDGAGAPAIEPGVLRCDWCDRETVEAERGWRAMRMDPCDRLEVVVICPDCADELNAQRRGVTPDTSG